MQSFHDEARLPCGCRAWRLGSATDTDLCAEHYHQHLRHEMDGWSATTTARRINRRWAEEEVLGTVLANPNLLPQLRATCRPSDFHCPEHRTLFSVFCSSPRRGEIPTVEALRDALRPLIPTLNRLSQHRDYGHFDVILERLVGGRNG